jgi:hypothetical protein
MNTEQTLEIVKDIESYQNQINRTQKVINKLQSRRAKIKKDGLESLMFIKPEKVFESIPEDYRPTLIPFLKGKIRSKWYIMTFPKLPGFGMLVEAVYMLKPGVDKHASQDERYTHRFFSIKDEIYLSGKKVFSDTIKYEFKDIQFDISIVSVNEKYYDCKGVLSEAHSLGVKILCVSDSDTLKSEEGSMMVDTSRYNHYLLDYFGRKIIHDSIDKWFKVVLSERKKATYSPIPDRPDWHDHMEEMEYREYMSDQRGDG